MVYNTKKSGRPKGTTKIRKPIDKDMFNTLLLKVESSSLSYDDKMMSIGSFLLLRYGGFRVSELVGLNAKDLWDLNLEHTIHLRNNTKRKHAREVYFDEEPAKRIFESFRCFVDLNDPKAVLFRGRGGKYDKCNKGSFTRKLNDILHTLLGSQYSTHSFRSGHITDMHDAGISMRVVQSHIGHTSINTTMRYVDVKEDAKKEAVKIL